MVDPGFILHICYVFSRLTPANLADDVRQLAGLVLKEGLRRLRGNLDTGTRDFVRQELLVALCDAHSSAVRKTAGSVITSIALVEGLETWPHLFPALHQLLDGAAQQQAIVAAAGLSCIAKICEDT